MNSSIYQSYGIYDRTPVGVMRHIRKYITNAQTALSEFRFADAKKQLDYAAVLSATLHTDLETSAPGGTR